MGKVIFSVPFHPPLPTKEKKWGIAKVKQVNKFLTLYAPKTVLCFSGN